MAFPIQNAAPLDNPPPSLIESINTLGRGFSISSTPSTPMRRAIVRSTVTVVFLSMNFCTSSAIFLAAIRALSIKWGLRFNLLSIHPPLTGTFLHGLTSIAYSP